MAVVAHAGINRFLLSLPLELSLHDSFSLPQPIGGITIILDTERGLIPTVLGKCPKDLPPPIPDDATCLALLEEFGTRPRPRQHGQAVADLATDIAVRLQNRGYSLNPALARASALLHDIARTQSKHAEVGALWLARKGYGALASIVGDHMVLPIVEEAFVSEKTVVFLADKLVRETESVTLEERYTGRPVSEQQRNLVDSRFRQAQRVYVNLQTAGGLPGSN